MLELEPAGLDLGEVEDVVDDGQQRLAALADGLGGLALLGREGRIQQQARHADDAIHGRADLVAHHREELALGDVGLLRGLLGHTQQLGLTLALGDVELQAHVAGALAAFIGQRLDLQFNPDLPAVLRVGEDFTEIRPAHLCSPGHRLQCLRVGLGSHHESDRRPALDLFQGETEQPRKAVVDPLHAPLWVSEDHATGGATRHQREPAGFRLGAAQVGGHAFRELERTAAGVHQRPGQERTQRAADQAARQHGQGQLAEAGGVKFRTGAEPQRPAPAVEVERDNTGEGTVRVILPGANQAGVCHR